MDEVHLGLARFSIDHVLAAETLATAPVEVDLDEFVGISQPRAFFNILNIIHLNAKRTFNSGSLLIVHANGMAIVDQVVRRDRVVHAQRRQLIRVLDIAQVDVDRALVWPAAAREVGWPIMRRDQGALIAPVFFWILDFTIFVVYIIGIEINRIGMARL